MEQGQLLQQRRSRSLFQIIEGQSALAANLTHTRPDREGQPQLFLNPLGIAYRIAAIHAVFIRHSIAPDGWINRNSPFSSASL